LSLLSLSHGSSTEHSGNPWRGEAANVELLRSNKVLTFFGKTLLQRRKSAKGSESFHYSFLRNLCGLSGFTGPTKISGSTELSTAITMSGSTDLFILIENPEQGVSYHPPIGRFFLDVLSWEFDLSMPEQTGGMQPAIRVQC
jgi:hypothetical protein